MRAGAGENSFWVKADHDFIKMMRFVATRIVRVNLMASAAMENDINSARLGLEHDLSLSCNVDVWVFGVPHVRQKHIMPAVASC